MSNPLSEEDVARMRELHTPVTSVTGSHSVCCTCLGYWPCDAYRLLEERMELEKRVAALEKDSHSPRPLDEALGALSKRISELESAPKAGVTGSIPLGLGFEEWKVQEIAAIRRSEKLPDMSQRVGTPKAEAPMTREAVEQELDRHLSNIGALNRERAIAFGLSIAAAARKEAEEERDQNTRRWHLLLQDIHNDLDVENMDPVVLTRFQETLATGCVSGCGTCEEANKAEHSRQALAEALRDLINEEGDEPMVEHEHFIAPGIRCPRCLIVKALAAHGQEGEKK